MRLRGARGRRWEEAPPQPRRSFPHSTLTDSSRSRHPAALLRIRSAVPSPGQTQSTGHRRSKYKEGQRLRRVRSGQKVDEKKRRLMA